MDDGRQGGSAGGGSGSGGPIQIIPAPDDGYFARTARNALASVANFAKETVYYVHDVDAGMLELYFRSKGINVKFEDWSAAALTNPPNNPDFWPVATNRAFRAGNDVLTLGGREIVGALYYYSETDDLDGAQQQLFSVATSNLAAAGTMKLTLPRAPVAVGNNPFAQALRQTGVIEVGGGEMQISLPSTNVRNPPILIGASTAEAGMVAGTDAAAIEAGGQIRIQAESVPGRVQSRINVSGKGFGHVTDRHYAGSGSPFGVGELELRAILKSKEVVRAPVTRLLWSDEHGYLFVRHVRMSRTIGLDNRSGFQPTSILTVITDRYGNLITAHPGVP